MTIYQATEDRLNDYIIELQTLKGMAIKQSELLENVKKSTSNEDVLCLKENTHELLLHASSMQVELSKIINQSYDIVDQYNKGE